MYSKQVIMVSLEQLVSEYHQYCKSKEIFDFSVSDKILSEIESPTNYKGFRIKRLFKCLLLQYISDSTSAK